MGTTWVKNKSNHGYTVLLRKFDLAYNQLSALETFFIKDSSIYPFSLVNG